MLLKDVSVLKEVPMFNGQHDPQNANEHFIYGIKSVMEYIDNMPIVCTGCDKCHEKMVRYGFKIYKTEVEGRVFWVAESEYLKGCVGQGESIAEALSELAINEEEWLAAAEEHGIEIPEPTIKSEARYSTKFMIRVSPKAYKEAMEHAAREGISLNQYVNNAIAAWTGRSRNRFL